MAEQALSDEEMRRENIFASQDLVLAYFGGDTYRAFIAWLDAIEQGYADDFRSVSRKELRYKQGAVQQVRMMRQILIEKNADRLPKL